MICYSANNSLMKFGRYTYTPAQLFKERNGRCRLPLPEENEIGISNLISQINKSRFADHYQLERAVDSRIKFIPNQYVLVLREDILGIKTVVKKRHVKIRAYFSVGKVEEKLSEDRIKLRLKNDKFRVCHPRQLRLIAASQYDEMVKEFEGD